MDATDEQRLLLDWAEYNVPAELLDIAGGLSMAAAGTAACGDWPFPSPALAFASGQRAALP